MSFHVPERRGEQAREIPICNSTIRAFIHCIVVYVVYKIYAVYNNAQEKLFLFERRELKMFLFLIQLDYWQAMDAESGGDFAAVMDVMFEHTPDDLLARNCGSHFSRTSRRIQPHLGKWLERRLDQFRVTHTFRLI